MIDAYYSRGCDSRELFAPYEIAQAEDFAEHLNKYNVLHFDTASFFNSAKTPEESKQFLALGYITGILPMKMLEGESELNNFHEYTMIRPRGLGDFFGFTQEEVEEHRSFP